mmetsp:Transcript_8997/g.12490  ORF Transcript_8997/g.12490 Transcript_8997/m.12490 type:complete len:217 (+) Transcript_8997:59-709(+)
MLILAILFLSELGYSVALQISPRVEITRIISQRAETRSENEMGLHGSSFCFIPLEQLDSDLSWPRILRVAGAYPGVTVDEIKNAALPPAPGDKGNWIYEFPDTFGAEYGMIAVPGSDILDSCQEPIVLVASAQSLGLQLRNPDTEVLCVCDRSQTDFSDRSFFAFADSNSNVSIGRFDHFDASFEVLARLVLVFLPFDPSTMAKSGTWLEEGDVSM